MTEYEFKVYLIGELRQGNQNYLAFSEINISSDCATDRNSLDPVVKPRIIENNPQFSEDSSEI